MLLLAGLGNPGPEYEKTRHNIGFMVIDEIIRLCSFGNSSKKYKADYSEGAIAGQKVIALKPQTFMNNSGISVSEAANFYKIPLDKIFVFHDELDIELGRVKVKTGGGNGGHNGLRSIDAHLGNEYVRVRLGIGHPGDKDLVTPFVLGKFLKEEELLKNQVVGETARNIEFLANGQPDLFMCRIAEAINLVKEKDNGI